MKLTTGGTVLVLGTGKVTLYCPGQSTDLTVGQFRHVHPSIQKRTDANAETPNAATLLVLHCTLRTAVGGRVLGAGRRWQETPLAR